MTKEWVEKRIAEAREEAQKYREQIVECISESDMSALDKAQALKSLDKLNGYNRSMFKHTVLFAGITAYQDDPERRRAWVKKVEDLPIEDLIALTWEVENCESRYLDSEPVEFDGDIIITDPCYVIRSENEMTPDDWGASGYGENMGALGITHYMSRDTLYGDWGCTVYDTDSGEEIGEFCADAGMVSVMLLDDVLRYNPAFDYHLVKCWTTAWIEDFKGTVQFVVTEHSGTYEYDSEFHKAGDKWFDYHVEVVGHGINKKTGKPINFVCKQTEL